jgi:hypothetical protein
MEKQFVTTSANPRISLDISGDLRLKGQDDTKVTARAENSQDLWLETADDQVSIRCTTDCSVRVPRGALVEIKAAHGDAILKALDGEVSIASVDGDLQLRNIGGVKIDTVRGEMVARNIEGDLVVDKVYGDLSARRVQGNFSVTGMASGNLNLSDVGGSAKASASGNVVLRLDPAPGHDYEFAAQGNVFCRLPDDASVEISVPKASQVMVDLPGIHASAPVQTPYAFTMGEGDAHLTLSASGNVVLDTHAPDWDMEDFDIDVDSEVNGMADAVSQQITQQVESQMRMMESQLDAQLSSLSMRLSAAKLTSEQARRIEERAREASLRATARAQERVQRAQQRMEQKMAAIQRKMEQKAQKAEHTRHREHAQHSRHGWSFTFPTSPASPTPPSEPVSEDERLAILRMLEEKKITMEQAEELLSALEGKS